MDHKIFEKKSIAPESYAFVNNTQKEFLRFVP